MTLLLIVGLLASPGVLTLESVQQSGRMPVITVTGCATLDGTTWWLTAASDAMPLQAGGPSPRAADSVQWARQERGGKERYRLIGRPLLEEFKIDAHRGHRIVVRGLLVSDVKEKRVNVVSLAMVDTSCN